MYLNLGQDSVIKTDSIVGIFDMDTSTVSKITRSYLALCEKQGRVVNVSQELPKSFVLCTGEHPGEFTLYISQISSGTLLKRSRFVDRISL